MEHKSIAIPVLLVTGFLGSGKTTFLNWLIHTHPDLKISLILNEFGDIKLESQFIKEHNGEIAELANGCMCCIAKSDIPRVVNLILEKSPETEYIVIEASGLSDPDPIRDAIRGAILYERVYLSSTICIVDAVNFEKSRDEHSIVMSQVGDADTVVISKVNEAGTETTNRVQGFIESIGVGTQVYRWDDTLDPNDFLQQQVVDHTKHENRHDHHHDHETYDEFWYKSDSQLNLESFEKLMKSLPENIIRVKGYIYSEAKKVMIQYVPNKLELFKKEWEGEVPSTALLFLGKAVDKEFLLKQLSLCELH